VSLCENREISRTDKVVHYAFRSSCPVIILRTKAEARAKIETTQLSSPVILVNKLLIITRRNFSKVNMSLSHLPFELLRLILTNIFPDKWSRFYSWFEILNLRTVCRKYSKRVFKGFR
jgi:hypothetical protein